MDRLSLRLDRNPELAAMFAGKNPGDKVSMTVQGVLVRNDAEEATLTIMEVEGGDLIPEEDDEDEEEGEGMENIREEDKLLTGAIGKKNSKPTEPPSPRLEDY